MKKREIIRDDTIYFDVDGPYKKIYLTRGLFAKVDVWTYSELNEKKWSATHKNAGYYAKTRSGKGHLLMHRYILGLEKGQCADHKNGNGLDNRRRNLRIATKSQNGCNRGSVKGSSSRYKGVSWRKWGSWQGHIKVNGRLIHLGCFKSIIKDGVDIGEIEAAKAYDRAARRMHGEFAFLNFPLVSA